MGMQPPIEKENLQSPFKEAPSPEAKIDLGSSQEIPRAKKTASVCPRSHLDNKLS